ncbi:alpha/beta fold hydrolase [Rheinheimera sp. SA_1]|uniref:alpha/beta fold hydrolase n=1 Tax=Rheinheimera sp. SA_1 TaxID=1827365 RepID=UPI0009EE8258|nr:alpha/beta fold hydrolase [Rheinheimera sp. SA_1]
MQLNTQLSKQFNATDFIVDKAEQPVARLLLAHGAGAPMDSDYLQQLAKQLAAQGIEVWRFNFGYMAKTVAGKKQPPSKVATLLQEIAAAIRTLPDDLPLFIGGKSMGGRVATLLAADAAVVDKPLLPGKVQGVLAFGYPFCPPAKKQLGIEPRTLHFAKLQQPLLIVQGDRDAFGMPEDLAGYSWPLVEISWLEGGDHDLKTLKRHSHTQSQLLTQTAAIASIFIRRTFC